MASGRAFSFVTVYCTNFVIIVCYLQIISSHFRTSITKRNNDDIDVMSAAVDDDDVAAVQ